MVRLALAWAVPFSVWLWLSSPMGQAIFRLPDQGGDLTCDETAPGLSQSQVSTFLASATTAGSSGDPYVYCLPAGSASWATAVSWSAPAYTVLVGAGDLEVVGGDDQTVITDNLSGGSPVLTISTNATGTFRLAGITIQTGTGAIKESGILSIMGTSSQVRIDHIHIDKTTGNGGSAGKLMYVGGLVEGVMDHVIHEFGSNIGWTHMVNGDNSAAGDNGDSRWDDVTGFGTADSFYIEDSEFISTYSGDGPPLGTVTDCHTGGKFVIRYSTGVNTNFAQTHPTGHAGDDRGCRAFELYGNTVTSTVGADEPNFSFHYNNSGPSLMWGNSLDDVYKNILYMNICRQDSDCGYNPPYGGWELCDGDGPWDGNVYSTGSPCIDQPGRGIGDLINGDFPSKTNQALMSASWPRQALEPIYEWSTTGDQATGWGGSWLNNGGSPQLVQNRDFYLHHNNTGCDPDASACTTGVGVGTLAQRPSNCTTTSEAGGGVAWWATDQGGNWHTTNGTSNDGQLYRCSATNTWTVHYTPYTYPHPLVD